MRHRFNVALRYACYALILANIAMGAVWLLRTEPGATATPSPHDVLPVLERVVGHSREGAVLGYVPLAINTGNDVCLASSSFASLRDAMAFAGRIEAAGGYGEVREALKAGRPDHVVYVEPAASRDAAHRIVRELEGQSIRAQVVGAGVLANAVTVGVFAERVEAEALLARVAAFGYPVKRRSLERVRTVYLVHSRAGVLPDGEMAWPPCEPSVLDGH